MAGPRGSRNSALRHGARQSPRPNGALHERDPSGCPLVVGERPSRSAAGPLPIPIMMPVAAGAIGRMHASDLRRLFLHRCTSSGFEAAQVHKGIRMLDPRSPPSRDSAESRQVPPALVTVADASRADASCAGASPVEPRCMQLTGQDCLEGCDHHHCAGGARKPLHACSLHRALKSASICAWICARFGFPGYLLRILGSGQWFLRRGPRSLEQACYG